MSSDFDDDEPPWPLPLENGPAEPPLSDDEAGGADDDTGRDPDAPRAPVIDLQRRRIERTLLRAAADIYLPGSSALQPHEVAPRIAKELEAYRPPAAQGWKTLAARGRDPEVAPPARDWLLRHDGHPLLARGIAAMLAGETKIGKSILGMQLALSVASGVNWLGAIEVVHPGPVLVLCAEEDQDEVDRRVHYLAGAMLGREQRRIAYTRLTAVGMLGERVSLLRGSIAGPEPTEIFGSLLSHVRATRPSLVILDPLAHFGGAGVESDNEVATVASQLMAQLALTASKPTVMVVHHSRKMSAQERTEDRAGIHAVRGVSGLTAGVRSVWTVTSKRNGGMLHFPGSNYAPPRDPIELRRDEHGYLRPLTSLEEDELTAKATRSEVEKEEAKRARLAARDAERNAARARAAADAEAIRSAKVLLDAARVVELLAEQPGLPTREFYAAAVAAGGIGRRRADVALARLGKAVVRWSGPRLSTLLYIEGTKLPQEILDAVTPILRGAALSAHSPECDQGDVCDHV